MLLSVALFAVVGGALAFKAKFSTTFCTTPAQSGVACQNLACPTKIIGVKTSSVNPLICTTTYDGNNCLSIPQCAAKPSVSLIAD